MPLKITDLKHPSSTSIINRWADDKEQDLQQHSNQIRTLQQQIADLQKRVK